MLVLEVYFSLLVLYYCLKLFSLGIFPASFFFLGFLIKDFMSSISLLPLSNKILVLRIKIKMTWTIIFVMDTDA